MRVWTYLYSAAKEPEGCGKVTEYCLIAGRKNEDEAASGYDKIKEKRREQSRKSRCFFHKKGGRKPEENECQTKIRVLFQCDGNDGENGVSRVAGGGSDHFFAVW